MSRRTRLLIAAVLVLLPLGLLVAVTDRAPAVRLMGSSPADAQDVARPGGHGTGVHPPPRAVDDR
ncbi:hypothetical protein AB0J68_27820, partial [Micromonospora sp. NPDC049580]|uniref:hypothetical protein n=1 Tax=Micromonospora sp. NPDC049580 TaxID=3154832 RepID=UPI00342E5D0A